LINLKSKVNPWVRYTQCEWRSNGHDSIAHQPLTALEQWKASRHRSLWVAVGICRVQVNRSSLNAIK